MDALGGMTVNKQLREEIDGILKSAELAESLNLPTISRALYTMAGEKQVQWAMEAHSATARGFFLLEALMWFKRGGRLDVALPLALECAKDETLQVEIQEIFRRFIDDAVPTTPSI